MKGNLKYFNCLLSSLLRQKKIIEISKLKETIQMGQKSSDELCNIGSLDNDNGMEEESSDGLSSIGSLEDNANEKEEESRKRSKMNPRYKSFCEENYT